MEVMVLNGVFGTVKGISLTVYYNREDVVMR